MLDVLCHISDLNTIVVRDYRYSFPRNTEFWAKPQNLPVSVEFLHFHRIFVLAGDKVYECRKGLCSRLQCRLTGHCTMMSLSTYVSSHQLPTSRLDKDFGLPLLTSSVFLLSDCLLLDVVLSLSLAHMSGTLFLPTSLQHLLCSLSENV